MPGLLIASYLRDNGIKQKWLAEQLDITERRMSLIVSYKVV